MIWTAALRWRFCYGAGRSGQAARASGPGDRGAHLGPEQRRQYGGGGTVWDGMAYDPELDLLYVGVGNTTPYPQWVRSPAGGDNLFTDSLLAINPRTGRLVWYYQQTPGDQWDIGSNAPMILVDREIDGQMRKLLLHAPIERTLLRHRSHQRQSVPAKPFAQVNWLTGIDPQSGRPQIDRATVDYRNGPKLVFPRSSARTAGSRWPTARRTGLVYLPTLEAGNIIYDITPERGYRPSLFNANVGFAFLPGIEANQAICPDPYSARSTRAS
jgi:quinohemoprotein ethanol dehydrogenase